jgi:hypothetical protein
VAAAVAADPYFTGARASDYGFTLADWQQADTKAWGNHVSFGVKPYISERTTTALQQMIYPAGNTIDKKQNIALFPNPAQNEVYSPAFIGKDVRIFQINGTLVKTIRSVSGTISVSDLSDGTYMIDAANAARTLLLIRH